MKGSWARYFDAPVNGTPKGRHPDFQIMLPYEVPSALAPVFIGESWIQPRLPPTSARVIVDAVATPTIADLYGVAAL